jgi:hypothetical protein
MLATMLLSHAGYGAVGATGSGVMQMLSHAGDNAAE